MLVGVAHVVHVKRWLLVKASRERVAHSHERIATRRKGASARRQGTPEAGTKELLELLQPLLRRQARERGKLLTTAHLRHHLLQHSMRIDAMRKAMACYALRDGGGQQCVILGHELHRARKIVMR